MLDHRVPVSDVVGFLGDDVHADVPSTCHSPTWLAQPTKAGCWPRTKSRGMKGSPCSPSLPWWMRWTTPQSSSHRHAEGSTRTASLRHPLADLERTFNRSDRSGRVRNEVGACSACAMHSQPALLWPSVMLKLRRCVSGAAQKIKRHP